MAINTAKQQASFTVTEAKFFDADQLKEAFAKVNFNDITVLRKPGD